MKKKNLKYDIPYYENLNDYKLVVKGQVERELEITLDQLVNNYPTKKLIVTLGKYNKIS